MIGIKKKRKNILNRKPNNFYRGAGTVGPPLFFSAMANILSGLFLAFLES
jgi:hypothetical protein